MSNNTVFEKSDDQTVTKNEIHPATAPGAETQRFSKFPGEVDEEEADLYITPLGIDTNSLYNATLLFLPYFYSSRTYLVLKSAKLAEEEIKSTIATAASKDTVIMPTYWPDVKIAWNTFLDSLGNEWKTLNLISALLLSAIYNVLQLGGQGNSLTQCTALMSLFSALMSLILGCLYLIRFETMRRTYKAIQWSSDALKTSRIVVWNIYALLALPAAWLAWSLVFFVVCLMSIVWQPIDATIGSSTSGLGPLHLASKIAVSVLLFAGMVHFSIALVASAGYGSRLDKSWSKKLKEFREATATNDTSMKHTLDTIVISGGGSVNPAPANTAWSPSNPMQTMQFPVQPNHFGPTHQEGSGRRSFHIANDGQVKISNLVSFAGYPQP